MVPAFTGETLGQQFVVLSDIGVGFGIAFAFGYWQLVLVALAVLPAMGFGMAIELMVMTGTAEDGGGGIGSKASQIVSEVVRSIRTVSSLTLERNFLGQFQDSLDMHLKKEQVMVLAHSMHLTSID